MTMELNQVTVIQPVGKSKDFLLCLVVRRAAGFDHHVRIVDSGRDARTSFKIVESGEFKSFRKDRS